MYTKNTFIKILDYRNYDINKYKKVGVTNIFFLAKIF